MLPKLPNVVHHKGNTEDKIGNFVICVELPFIRLMKKKKEKAEKIWIRN